MLFTVFGILSAALFFIGAALLGSLHLFFGGAVIGTCTALWWTISRGAKQERISTAGSASHR